VPGHCVIVPMQHEIASTMVDEDVWKEIQLFRQCLMRMFAEEGKDVIFLETVTTMKKKYHMVIECVPLPKRDADVAPGYFKKAINDSEGEWLQHKKLIDTTGKGIRRAVPPNFPYFHVEFGDKGGFAHVIEDSSLFPFQFGTEVIAGILELPPQNWAHSKRESFETERQKVLTFVKTWEPFDWTLSLDGGE